MTISDESSERLTRLEQQMEQVSGRLTALEQAAGRRAPNPPAPGPRADVMEPGGPEWAETGETTFSYSGQGQFGADRVVIRQRARLSQVLEADPDQVAKVFAALGSPARITVLRALLDGPRTSQQLRAELDDASVGQLYHHLRELMAVGLIVQPGRSQYAIMRGSHVPLCIEIIAAAQLSSGAPRSLSLDEEPSATDGVTEEDQLPPGEEVGPGQEGFGAQRGDGDARRVPAAGVDEEPRLPVGAELGVELIQRLVHVLAGRQLVQRAGLVAWPLRHADRAGGFPAAVNLSQ
ncbi:MAG: helix-turn-helix transcriptional regulator [Streptosporangiaceae bacterium]|nr:helix-turn-helix transcriptional regulator [Streptosporangiaceae bacterium]